jgi:hypothetical protein
MDEIQLSTGQFYILALIIGAVLGALFGLVPLILGRKRNKGRLGLYGFVVSIVLGAATPLLSIIAVAIFVWLIVKKDPASGGSGGAA